MLSYIAQKVISLTNRIYHLIQRVQVTNSLGVTTGEYPVIQVISMKKTVDMENISPYGLASALPIDAFGVKWNIQGESSNAVGLAYDPKTLPVLKINEVAVGAFSATIPTYLKFTNEGTIQVWKGGSIVIADLITHLHSGVTTGSGNSGPPIP